MRHYITEDGHLMHYGIPGMKKGVRRFVTAAGKLTAAGKARYAKFSKSAGRSLRSFGQRARNNIRFGKAAAGMYGKLARKYAGIAGRKIGRFAAKAGRRARRFAGDARATAIRVGRRARNAGAHFKNRANRILKDANNFASNTGRKLRGSAKVASRTIRLKGEHLYRKAKKARRSEANNVKAERVKRARANESYARSQQASRLSVKRSRANESYARSQQASRLSEKRERWKNSSDASRAAMRGRHWVNGNKTKAGVSNMDKKYKYPARRRYKKKPNAHKIYKLEKIN